MDTPASESCCSLTKTSEVWLAEHEQDGFVQQVALKLLRTGRDDVDLVRRFLQERRILAGLSHPRRTRDSRKNPNTGQSKKSESRKGWSAERWRE